MQTAPKILSILCKAAVLSFIAVAITAPPARAQDYLSGTYKCVSVEVAGKTHRCKAPSLEMNSDGSYQILAERGTQAGA